MPSSDGDMSEDLALRSAINEFIGTLNSKQRKMFLMRYFYLHPVKKIASDMRLTVSNVKITLMRIREGLKDYLEKEGIIL